MQKSRTGASRFIFLKSNLNSFAIYMYSCFDYTWHTVTFYVYIYGLCSPGV